MLDCLFSDGANNQQHDLTVLCLVLVKRIADVDHRLVYVTDDSIQLYLYSRLKVLYIVR